MYAVACSPATAIVAAASGAAVTLHDSATGSTLTELRAGGGVLYALSFSPSGACLLAAGSEELVHAFRMPSGTTRAVLRLDRGVAKECQLNTACINAIAFDGECAFLSGGYDAAVTRWALPPASPCVERRTLGPV